MLNIGKFSKLVRISSPCPKLFSLLAMRPACNFTLIKKKQQLIMHSEVEVEKMHNKKEKKQNKWQTFTEPRDLKYRVSLIGLPNSGKSTLFNCLVGEPLAIVDNHPGMTRDRKQFDIMEGLVRIVDTPGVEVTALEKAVSGNLKHDIFKQTAIAIHESDLILVVLDSTKPVSHDEIEMIKYLRKFASQQKIALVCTKSQKLFDQTLVQDEVNKLAIDNIFVCSGATGQGIFEILNFIDSQVPFQAKENLKKLKLERTRKFEEVVKRMKEQMKEMEEKGMNIKSWQYDFRKINPQPQMNPDLDYEQFEDFLIKPESTFSATRGTEIKNLKMKNTIKICLIGRPNVGKSSIINQILGTDRLVVSDTPHTTRDSIASKILYKNRKIELIDTAGIDNHELNKTEEEYIKKSQISTMLHVKQSHVVVYVMDAYSAFKIEDFKLIRNVVEEGRPIIIAVNKWEAIKDEYKYKAKNYLFKQIDQNLGHIVHGHPIVFVSAKLNDGIDNLIDNIIATYDKWNCRISTGMLNDWLDKFKKLDNLPKVDDMTLKINYLIQARVRPPHFIFFVNNKKIFKDNYMRFVTDNIAKEFKMDGIPLRTTLRSTNNKENEKKSEKSEPKKMSQTKLKMDELKKKYRNFGL